MSMNADTLEALAHGWDGALAVDKGGEIIRVTLGMAQLLGMAPGDMAGMTLENILPRRAHEWHSEQLRQAIDLGIGPRDMSASERTIAAIHAHGHPVEMHSEILTHDGLGVVRVRVPVPASPDDDDTIILNEDDSDG